jgi:hypothetical protein
MANKQYQKGVRLEREIVKLIKAGGGQATRTAGSHGWCDVVGKFTYKTGSSVDTILPGFNAQGEYVAGDTINLARIGKTYVDHLFIDDYNRESGAHAAFIDGEEVVLLIQCKRKAR